MVLIDTSIWIRYFMGLAEYRPGLDRLLAGKQVAGHELVYGELLIGDRGARKRSLATYELLRQAKTVPHDDVVALVRFRKLHGRGVGWIDVHLLASAMAEHMQFWTADDRLAEIARELGVGYK